MFPFPSGTAGYRAFISQRGSPFIVAYEPLAMLPATFIHSENPKNAKMQEFQDLKLHLWLQYIMDIINSIFYESHIFYMMHLYVYYST